MGLSLQLHQTVPAVEVGPLWVHEIKHDGYRMMVRRDGSRVRCFTLNSHDWANRFLAIVEAAARFKAQSFLIDGEVAGLASVAEPTPRCCSPFDPD